MSDFWRLPPSADQIKKELVRTRCLSCRHEVICAIVAGLPEKDVMVFGLSCRQYTPGGDMRAPGKCGGLLRIISARGVHFRLFKLGAESYDIATDFTIPSHET